MIERRPFNQLAAADHGWLKARHHFSFGEHMDPARTGWGTLRVWNDDEIASNTRLSAPSARRHGDHHLRPRGRHHAQGQSRQRGPNRGRRRAGDECRIGCPARRIQPRAGADADFPDLDRTHAAWRFTGLGLAALSEGRSLGTLRHAGQRL